MQYLLVLEDGGLLPPLYRNNPRYLSLRPQLVSGKITSSEITTSFTQTEVFRVLLKVCASLLVAAHSRCSAASNRPKRASVLRFRAAKVRCWSTRPTTGCSL